ncbi:MAG: hypothetical protein LHV69_04590 [Elusimicrobia bacterium]|nr:hypothetical protein [Candidatus Obscuribacterium magneticum]
MKKPLAVFLSVILFWTQVLMFHRPALADETRPTQGALPAVKNSDRRSNGEGLSSALGTFNADELTMCPPALRRILESFPPELGFIDELTLPPHPAVGFVLHIRDIHRVELIQRSLAKGVEKLVQHHPIDRIALEGMEGPLDLKAYLHPPERDVIRQVGDYLLSRGLLSGPAYAALTQADKMPPVVGGEDRATYQKNVDALRRAYRRSAPLASRLEQVGQILSELKKKHFNPDLNVVDGACAQYWAGKMPPRDLLKILDSYAIDLPLDLEVFLTYQSVFSDLMKKASGRAPLGKVDPSLFVRQLSELAASLKPQKLQREIDRVATTARFHLARSPVERDILLLSDRHRLCVKMVAFSLTPDDWKSVKEWRPLTETGPSDVIEGVRAVNGAEEKLEDFRRFYELAEQRDGRIVSTLKRIVLDEGGRAVVLVAGGFHGNGIRKGLLKAGIAYVSCTPPLAAARGLDAKSNLASFLREETPLEKSFRPETSSLSPPPVGPVCHIFMAAGALAKSLISRSTPLRRWSTALFRRWGVTDPRGAILSPEGSQKRARISFGFRQKSYAIVAALTPSGFRFDEAGPTAREAFHGADTALFAQTSSWGLALGLLFFIPALAVLVYFWVRHLYREHLFRELKEFEDRLVEAAVREGFAVDDKTLFTVLIGGKQALTTNANKKYNFGFNTLLKGRGRSPDVGIVRVSYEVRDERELKKVIRFIKMHPRIIGAVVSAPWKERVLPYVDDLTPKARETGVVSNIAKRRGDGKLVGHSLDGIAFLKAYGSTLQLSGGKIPFQASLIGAGATSRQVAFELVRMGVRSFHLTDINIEMAQRLKNDLQKFSPGLDVNVSRLESDDFYARLSESKLVVNASGIGEIPLSADQSPIKNFDHLRPGQTVIDLIRNPNITQFLLKAHEQGLQFLANGVEMARMNTAMHITQWFERWFNVTLDTDKLYQQLLPFDHGQLYSRQAGEILMPPSDMVDGSESPYLKKGKLFWPTVDFERQAKLDFSSIKPEKNAEEGLALIRKAKIPLVVEAPHRIGDGCGSALDIPEYQELLTQPGARSLLYIPSTLVFAGFSVRYRFEEASDPTAMEYAVDEKSDTGKRTRVVYQFRGAVKVDENGRAEGGMKNAIPYIFTNLFGLRGIRVVLEEAPLWPSAGTFEGSNVHIIILLMAASTISRAKLSQAQLANLGVALENKVFGGITGGQGVYASLLGGGRRLVWLSKLMGVYGAFAVPLPDHVLDAMEGHTLLVQTGVEYRGGKRVVSRLSMLTNTMWRDLLVNHDPETIHLFYRMLDLTEVYFDALLNHDFARVSSQIIEYVKIRNQLCKRWLHLAFAWRQEGQRRHLPPSAETYHAKVFDPSNPDYYLFGPVRKEYEKRGDAAEDMMPYAPEPMAGLIESAAKEGIALMPLGSGQQGTPMMAVSGRGADHMKRFFASKGLNPLDDDEYRSTMGKGGFIKGYTGFSIQREGLQMRGFTELGLKLPEGPEEVFYNQQRRAFESSEGPKGKAASPPIDEADRIVGPDEAIGSAGRPLDTSPYVGEAGPTGEAPEPHPVFNPEQVADLRARGYSDDVIRAMGNDPTVVDPDQSRVQRLTQIIHQHSWEKALEKILRFMPPLHRLAGVSFGRFYEWVAQHFERRDLSPSERLPQQEMDVEPVRRDDPDIVIFDLTHFTEEDMARGAQIAQETNIGIVPLAAGAGGQFINRSPRIDATRLPKLVYPLFLPSLGLLPHHPKSVLTMALLNHVGQKRHGKVRLSVHVQDQNARLVRRLMATDPNLVGIDLEGNVQLTYNVAHGVPLLNAKTGGVLWVPAKEMGLPPDSPDQLWRRPTGAIESLLSLIVSGDLLTWAKDGIECFTIFNGEDGIAAGTIDGRLLGALKAAGEKGKDGIIVLVERKIEGKGAGAKREKLGFPVKDRKTGAVHVIDEFELQADAATTEAMRETGIGNTNQLLLISKSVLKRFGMSGINYWLSVSPEERLRHLLQFFDEISPVADTKPFTKGSEVQGDHLARILSKATSLLDFGLALIDRNQFIRVKNAADIRDPQILGDLSRAYGCPFAELPPGFDSRTAAIALYTSFLLIDGEPLWPPAMLSQPQQKGEPDDPAPVAKLTLTRDSLLRSLRPQDVGDNVTNWFDRPGSLQEAVIPAALRLQVERVIFDLYRRGFQIVLAGRGIEFDKNQSVTFSIAPQPTMAQASWREMIPEIQRDFLTKYGALCKSDDFPDFRRSLAYLSDEQIPAEQEDKPENKILKLLVDKDPPYIYGNVRQAFSLFQAQFGTWAAPPSGYIVDHPSSVQISPSVRNVIMILAHRAKTDTERDDWRRFLLYVKPVWLAVAQNPLPGLVMLINKELVDEQADLVEEIMSSRYPKDLDRPGSPWSSPSSEDREMTLILKPPHGFNRDVVREILRRLVYFGYQVEGVRVLDGRFLDERKQMLNTLYQQHTEGFYEESVPSAVVEEVERIYNVPIFKKVFGEPFRRDMVVSGDQLAKRFDLKWDEMADMWHEGLRPITREEFQARHHLQKDIPIPPEAWIRGSGRDLIDSSQKGLPYGMNKMKSMASRYAMPVRVRDPATGQTRTMIVINGHVPGLLNLFTESVKPGETPKTIAFRIRNTGTSSAGWSTLRNEFHGANNPRQNAKAGSFRRDATLGMVPIPVDDRILISAERNVTHLSAGPLESMVETATAFFSWAMESTAFGALLLREGYSPDDLKALSTNPRVALVEGPPKTVFELTHEKDSEAALAILKNVFPPGSSGQHQMKALGLMPWTGFARLYRWAVKLEKEGRVGSWLPNTIAAVEGFAEEAILRPIFQEGIFLSLTFLLFGAGVIGGDLAPPLFYGIGFSLLAVKTALVVAYAFLFATVLHPKIFVGHDGTPLKVPLLDLRNIHRQTLFGFGLSLGLLSLAPNILLITLSHLGWISPVSLPVALLCLAGTYAALGFLHAPMNPMARLRDGAEGLGRPVQLKEISQVVCLLRPKDVSSPENPRQPVHLEQLVQALPSKTQIVLLIDQKHEDYFQLVDLRPEIRRRLQFVVRRHLLDEENVINPATFETSLWPHIDKKDLKKTLLVYSKELVFEKGDFKILSLQTMDRLPFRAWEDFLEELLSRTPVVHPLTLGIFFRFVRTRASQA